MNTQLSISRNLSLPKGAISDYNVYLSPTDSDRADLAQVGPVYNDRISYRGVFGGWGRAVEAALDYAGRPCQLVEITPAGETSTYRLLDIAEKLPPKRELTDFRVLGRRHRGGAVTITLRR